MSKILKMVLVGLVGGIGVYAQDAGKTIVPTKHNKELTLAQIAEIQPGLGTVMIEFGHRFHVAYYAAKANNWDLAKYEIHELIEAQEIAEVTRPKYAEKLKVFEHQYLDELNEAIQSKEWTKFAKKYTQAVNGCNACHAETGHPYIRYKLPKNPPLMPSMD